MYSTEKLKKAIETSLLTRKEVAQYLDISLVALQTWLSGLNSPSKTNKRKVIQFIDDVSNPYKLKEIWKSIK